MFAVCANGKRSLYHILSLAQPFLSSTFEANYPISRLMSRFLFPLACPSSVSNAEYNKGSAYCVQEAVSV